MGLPIHVDFSPFTGGLDAPSSLALAKPAIVATGAISAHVHIGWFRTSRRENDGLLFDKGVSTCPCELDIAFSEIEAHLKDEGAGADLFIEPLLEGVELRLDEERRTFGSLAISARQAPAPERSPSSMRISASMQKKPASGAAPERAPRIPRRSPSARSVQDVPLERAGTLKTVSLTMIVKNEAPNLEAAIAPVRGIVDDTVVVDTGSTDGTAARAERLGARVFHFPWCDSFSAARNEAITSSSTPMIASCRPTSRRSGRSSPDSVTRTSATR